MIQKITLSRIHLILIGLGLLCLLGSLPFIFDFQLKNSESIGANLNGVIPPVPATQKPYQVAFDNLTFNSPLNFTLVPNQNKIIIGQRDGKVYWFDNNQDTSTKNLLIDLSEIVGVVWDGGFLGLAIHPDFGTSGSNYLYVYYSTEDSNSQDYPDYYSSVSCNSEENWGNFLVLEKFEVDPTNLTHVPGSSVILIKRRMYGGSHRGGGLEFGDDGFLYLALGDNSIYKTSQDIVNNLDGGVLRLDVDKDPNRSHLPIRTMPENHGFSDEISGNGYWIPNDNPFLSPNGSNFEEYYSLGLRNPHRMTKDRLTGTFYIGDVGGYKYEEINVLSKGKNYGWPVFEGNGLGIMGCTYMYKFMPHEGPLVKFPRAEANSIIGGYVYRGTDIPELYGKYICADYGHGDEIWSVDTQTGNYVLLGNFLPADIISFGQDKEGEVYMLKLGDNVSLYKLAPPELILNRDLSHAMNDSLAPSYLTHQSINDPNASIDDRARAYLDINCASCHSPGTNNRAGIDLRVSKSLNETGLLTATTITPIGIEGEKILVPGDASKSILYHRLISLDPTIMMPPLDKSSIDDDGVVLIEEWINQMVIPADQLQLLQ